MAIARDTSGYLNFTATSGTLSYTCSGSDRILLVFTNNEAGADDITGVTYNGVALTQLGTGVIRSGSVTLRTWYLIAPATGANNIVVSRSTSADTWCLVVSYTGVSQTGFPDASATFQDSTSPMTGTLTTIADNAIAVMVGSGTQTQTASTGATFVLNNTSGAYQLYESTTFPITPAGSYSMSFTQADAAVAISMVSLAPPSSATSGKNFLAFMM